jgi:beta-glucoside operon transcriptional antiterminator
MYKLYFENGSGGITMRIHRILNNNAVVVKEENQEKIVMGPGIGFQKTKNDPIPKHQIEKIFVMEEESESFQQLLKNVSEKYISLSEDIIDVAEGKLGEPLSDHIHIALTDHLAFALERLQNGFAVKNKLLHEIKVLYKKEFDIALSAQSMIKDKLDISVPEDEVAHIALHLHTNKLNGQSMVETLHQTTVLNELMHHLEQCLHVSIDENSISHQRILTHLKFALSRLENGEAFHDMDEDMITMIKERYETAYHCAVRLSEWLQNEYNHSFPSSEVAYLALHIERIRQTN